MSTILKANNITMQFGGVKANSNVSLKIKKGEIRGLIGPNGAGKSTFFNVVSGLYIPTEGTIEYKEQDITTAKAHEISKLGIARTFQNILLFEDLSAVENVMVGHHNHTKTSLLDTLFFTRTSRSEEKKCREKALEMLDFVGLINDKDILAGNMPYGKMRILEIARALASEPDILLLDEPAAGLNSTEAMQLNKLIYKIRDKGVTILLVEHNMKVAMEVSDYVSVLDHGQLISEGNPEYVQNDSRVIEAYLGKED